MFPMGGAAQGGDVSDSALEEELAALLRGASPEPPRSRTRGGASHQARETGRLQAKQLDVTVGDANESDVDENDEELLAELKQLTCEDDGTVSAAVAAPAAAAVVVKSVTPEPPGGEMVQLLLSRLQMYRVAEANAKEAGEAARARRYSRALKTLDTQLKQVKAGRKVDLDSVPPEIMLPQRAAGGVSVAVTAAGNRQQRDGNEEKRQETGDTTQTPIPDSSHPQPDPPRIPPRHPEHYSRQSDAHPVGVVTPAVPEPRATSRQNMSAAAGGASGIGSSSERVAELNRPTTIPSAAARAPVETAGTAAIPVSASAARLARSPDPVPAASSSRPKLCTDGGEGVLSNGAAAAACVGGEEHPRLSEVRKRRDEYKDEALSARRQNDKQRALQCVQIVKAFDSVLDDMVNGREVDLSDMPSSPSTFLAALASASSAAAAAASAPATSLTLGQALAQHLQHFQKSEETARQSGDSSKARRCHRISLQYQQAISRHKAALPFNFSALPLPYGAAPLSQGQSAEKPAASPTPTSPATSPVPSSSVPSSSRGAAAAVGGGGGGTQQKISATNTAQSSQALSGGQAARERQLQLLTSRRKLFLQAALGAKKRGDLDTARDLLRQAKRHESLIAALNQGQCVDLTSLPLPPQLRRGEPDLADFDVISHSEMQQLVPPPAGDTSSSSAQLFNQLRSQLLKQAEFCSQHSRHYKALGDVQKSGVFLRLEQKSACNLQALQTVYSNSPTGQFSPNIHYETRQFQIVQACTDLRSDQLELTVVQGVNYALSSNDVDTYVKWEFPWPADAPTEGRTARARGATTVPYNATFSIAIDRNSRAMMRIFRRQSVRLTVWQRGRFFGLTDNVLGVALVRLELLADKCIVHQAFDITGARRAVKGKLEVKMRMRSPASTPHIERVTQNWLIIDSVS